MRPQDQITWHQMSSLPLLSSLESNLLMNFTCIPANLLVYENVIILIVFQNACNIKGRKSTNPARKTNLILDIISSWDSTYQVIVNVFSSRPFYWQIFWTVDRCIVMITLYKENKSFGIKTQRFFFRLAKLHFPSYT